MARKFHVAQDDFGLWFASEELEDKSLNLVVHATTLGDAMEDSGRLAALQGGVVFVEAKHHDFPVTEDDLRDYTPPKLRKVG